MEAGAIWTSAGSLRAATSTAAPTEDSSVGWARSQVFSSLFETMVIKINSSDWTIYIPGTFQVKPQRRKNCQPLSGREQRLRAAKFLYAGFYLKLESKEYQFHIGGFWGCPVSIHFFYQLWLLLRNKFFTHWIQSGWTIIRAMPFPTLGTSTRFGLRQLVTHTQYLNLSIGSKGLQVLELYSISTDGFCWGPYSVLLLCFWSCLISYHIPSKEF